MVKLGKYKHYNGNFYEVIGEAIHSETHEEMVIYKALYENVELGKNAVFVRPKKMFIEEVDINGKKVSRFEFAGNKV